MVLKCKIEGSSDESFNVSRAKRLRIPSVKARERIELDLISRFFTRSLRREDALHHCWTAEWMASLRWVEKMWKVSKPYTKQAANVSARSPSLRNQTIAKPFFFMSPASPMCVSTKVTKLAHSSSKMSLKRMSEFFERYQKRAATVSHAVHYN
jgi:hypothetical protein